MIVFTACAMAFAHGSNDVANGVGPLATVYGLVKSGGEVTQKLDMPLWILLLGGFGIALGLATFGYRVMRTIGAKITALTPTSGFLCNNRRSDYSCIGLADRHASFYHSYCRWRCHGCGSCTWFCCP